MPKSLHVFPAPSNFNQDLDRDAAQLIRRLQSYDYIAYLVGGGVRDLLLGRTPKDFDISTSARPEDLHSLFRNCRIIGRRFRLAHFMYSGGKIIEVSTFRALPPVENEGALIRDDNEFGTPESDANRRDFTINAFFYDPIRGEILDYVGGLADLKARIIRVIGEPKVRFGEDPVRMLRAVKFAARLDFSLEPQCRQAILDSRNLLRQAAVPRLFEELLRMLWGGAAAKSIELLNELTLLDLLMPEVSAYLDAADSADQAQLYGLLKALDKRCAGHQNVENGVLLAVLFWPIFRAVLRRLPTPPTPSKLKEIAHLVLDSAAKRFKIAHKDLSLTLSILESQVRLDPARKHTPRRETYPSEMLAGMVAFSELRFEAGQLSQGKLEAWRKYTSFDFSPRRRSRSSRHHGPSSRF